MDLTGFKGEIWSIYSREEKLKVASFQRCHSKTRVIPLLDSIKRYFSVLRGSLMDKIDKYLEKREVENGKLTWVSFKLNTSEREHSPTIWDLFPNLEASRQDWTDLKAESTLYIQEGQEKSGIIPKMPHWLALLLFLDSMSTFLYSE